MVIGGGKKDGPFLYGECSHMVKGLQSLNWNHLFGLEGTAISKPVVLMCIRVLGEVIIKIVPLVLNFFGTWLFLSLPQNALLHFR